MEIERRIRNSVVSSQLARDSAGPAYVPQRTDRYGAAVEYQ